MKKLSLLLALSFGLLVQADPSEMERADQNTELTAAELSQAGFEQVFATQDKGQESAQEDMPEDMSSSEQGDMSPIKKNGSRHIKSLLAGLASGIACEIATSYARDAYFTIHNKISGQGSPFGISMTRSKAQRTALAAVERYHTAAQWSITAARVALPIMALKKLYKEKKDVNYAKATIAKSAALAALGTSLTWIDLWIKLGLI